MTVGNINPITTTRALDDLHNNQLDIRRNKISIMVTKQHVTSRILTTLDTHSATFSQMQIINLGPIIEEKMSIVNNEDGQQTEKWT